MAKRWLWAGLLPVLAAAALLLTPGNSQAWGWGGMGAGYGGYGGYGGWSGGYGGWSGFRGGYGGYGGWSGAYSPYYTGYGAGWGGYPAYSGYGYTVPNYNAYWGNSYIADPFYNTTYESYPRIGTSRSYYPSANVTNGNRNDAHVRVEVPANAEVWFGGFKTTQTGTDRLFVSPPLDPKGNYKYEVRARWTENGRAVDRTRSVSIQAGKTVTVDFLKRQPENRSVTAPAAPPAIPAGETPTSAGP